MKNNTIGIDETRKKLARLFKSQKLAVLSTSDKGQPYTNLVAFMAAGDFSSIIFATTKATRKYANLAADPRVSLLIDNRTNREADFHRAMAVTALGTARELGDGERAPYQQSFLTRFPHLGEFVQSPGCALMMVKISKYYVVSRFQHVLLVELT